MRVSRAYLKSSFCAELIVKQAGFDILKLVALIGRYDYLPHTAATLLRKVLSKCVTLPEQERAQLWTALKKLVVRHRTYPDAQWSLSETSLKPIEELMKQLAPQSPNLIHKRLFSSDTYLHRSEWQEDEDKLLSLRKSAILEIISGDDLSELLKFTSTVSNPHIVGEVLAEIGDYNATVFPDLLSLIDQKLWSMVASYAYRRKFRGGWQWFDDINKDGWKPEQIALLLCALPFERSSWERAEELLGENEGEYWNNTQANFHDTDDNIQYSIEKLIKFGRPDTAVAGLQFELYKKNNLDPNFACDVLLSLVALKRPFQGINDNALTVIIESLQKNPYTDPQKLYRVEWAFLSVLQAHYSAPIAIENQLASDSSFFCEIVRLVFCAEGESPKETTERNRLMISNAYQLLAHWTVVPGMENGIFNPDAFLRWLKEIEESTKASQHYEVALRRLGNVLIHAPPGPNGLWIHPTIAESMNSKERGSLREGYRLGVFNSRGVHFVDPEAKPERALAKKFRLQATEVENIQCQRLAITLRELADEYDREAERILSQM